MTSTIEPARAERAQPRAAVAFVDCDVHNALPSRDTLMDYLEPKWQQRLQLLKGMPGMTVGGGLYGSRPNLGIFRWDAKPPSGAIPGSDFEFMKQDYLETWPVQRAILAPLDSNGLPQSGRFSGAICAAINDWMAKEWLSRDKRLYGSIVVPTEDGEYAAREIERTAPDKRFVQVLMFSRTRDPMGHRRYWPIYAAAAKAGLPIGVHVGGGGNPMTGAGWPSYHFEYHASFTHSFHSQVVSLISSGVFEEYPTLRFVMEEGGFAWVPALMWRMDRAWRLMGKDVTHLSQAPSEIIRRHLWFTTQPIDEPERPEHFLEMFGHLDRIGMADHIMYSTDYPHWDFDSPDKAIPSVVTGDLKERVFSRNAHALYRFAEDPRQTPTA